MAKLYLIRRNLETFSGPMTSVELKDAYKRMQFGLQDEVSGHCGPWVTLDDLSTLRRSYPEIARIIHEEMVSGWGVSEHSGKSVRQDSSGPSASSHKGLMLALIFLGLAFSAFLVALYFSTYGKLASRAREDVPEPTVEEAQGYIDRADQVGFDRYIQENIEFITDKVTHAKKTEIPWLTLLRLYALHTEGSISGLAPKVLRGDTATSAPMDCSLRTWRRRWRSSVRSWNELIVQHKLVRAHWSRLLAWDPYWMAKREGKGWPKGTSFYLLCTSMANKALAEMAADPSFVGSISEVDKQSLRQMKQRLDWIGEVAQTGQALGPNQQAALLGFSGIALWSCFEAARDPKELAKCRAEMPANPPADDPWATYNEERYGWSLLRIAMAQKGNLSNEMLNPLGQYNGRVSRGDFFTRFDYRYELKVWKALLKQSGPVEKTLEKLQGEITDPKP